MALTVFFFEIDLTKNPMHYQASLFILCCCYSISFVAVFAYSAAAIAYLVACNSYLVNVIGYPCCCYSKTINKIN